MAFDKTREGIHDSVDSLSEFCKKVVLRSVLPLAVFATIGDVLHSFASRASMPEWTITLILGYILYKRP